MRVGGGEGYKRRTADMPVPVLQVPHDWSEGLEAFQTSQRRRRKKVPCVSFQYSSSSKVLPAKKKLNKHTVGMHIMYHLLKKIDN